MVNSPLWKKDSEFGLPGILLGLPSNLMIYPGVHSIIVNRGPSTTDKSPINIDIPRRRKTATER